MLNGNALWTSGRREIRVLSGSVLLGLILTVRLAGQKRAIRFISEKRRIAFALKCVVAFIRL